MAAMVVDPEAIRQFCEENHVLELSLFGSVVREDFGPESDVDVLVEFAPGRAASLFRLVKMQEHLSAVFGRRVDLVSKRGLSRHLRERILRSREVLYGCEG